MKLRNGFVSNSSSSAFICDVCGAVESGMDLCMRDAEMFSCVAGHTICESHKLSPEGLEDLSHMQKRDKVAEYYEACNYVSESNKKYLNGAATDAEVESAFYELYDESEYYEIPSDFCPVCQFEDMNAYDLFAWFFATHPEMTEATLLSAWKTEYKTYAQFCKATKIK